MAMRLSGAIVCATKQVWSNTILETKVDAAAGRLQRPCMVCVCVCVCAAEHAAEVSSDGEVLHGSSWQPTKAQIEPATSIFGLQTCRIEERRLVHH